MPIRMEISLEAREPEFFREAVFQGRVKEVPATGNDKKEK